MNTFNRKATPIGVLLALGLLGALTANAAQSVTSTNPSCREQTRRVAIWPVAGNPAKGVQIPRFEKRTYVVCNHEKSPTKPA